MAKLSMKQLFICYGQQLMVSTGITYSYLWLILNGFWCNCGLHINGFQPYKESPQSIKQTNSKKTDFTVNLICTAKKTMEYERFGNCLTNIRQKSQYVFGQNFTDLVNVDRCHSLLTVFVAGSILCLALILDKIILWSF